MVATYPRVSTDDQTERETIQIQRQALATWVQANSLDLYAEYSDDGVSGATPLSSRPAGQRLLADARKGCFDTVLVYKLDRLGRDTRHVLNAVKELEECGVVIISIKENFDASTSAGRLMLEMLASFASFERRAILDRTQAGRVRRIREGYWPGGPPPFGYNLSEGRLAICDTPIPGLNQSPSHFARWAFQHMAYERGSLLSGCKNLNALGVPTRYVLHGWTGTRNLWTPTTLYNLLRNRAYRGVFRYEPKNGEEPIEVPCPALVPEETWFLAQQRMVENRKASTRNAKREYLLSGLIVCECGAHYCGHPRKIGEKVHRYYQCNRRVTKWQGYSADLPSCSNRALRAEDLESLVWVKVEHYLSHPSEVLEELVRRRAEQTENEDDLGHQRDQLHKALAGKEEEKDQILHLFRAKLITMSKVGEQFAEIDGQSRALRDRIDVIDARLRGMDDFGKDLSAVERLLDDLAQAHESADFQTRRFICRSLVRSIVVWQVVGDDHPVDIHWKFENPPIKSRAFRRLEIYQRCLVRRETRGKYDGKNETKDHAVPRIR